MEEEIKIGLTGRSSIDIVYPNRIIGEETDLAMQIVRQEIQLKNEKNIVIGSPAEEDAAALLRYLKQVSAETPFMVRYPEEVQEDGIEEEKVFLRRQREAEASFMLAAFEGNRVVGNIGVHSIGEQKKLKHRAGFGIAVIKEYWGLGLGSALFTEALRYVRILGYEQLELGVYADNKRAMALYEKMGFEKVGVIPRAFKLKDGTYHDEVQMVLRL